jgi:hypothetical protein
MLFGHIAELKKFIWFRHNYAKPSMKMMFEVTWKN